MKKIISSWLFLALLVVASSAYSQTFRVGFFTTEPEMVIGSDMTAQGPLVEYFRKVAAKMGIQQVEFVNRPLARLFFELDDNNIDAALVLTMKPDRAAKYVYPKTPLCLADTGVVVLKSSPVKKIVVASDLLPLRIGAVGGSAITPILSDKASDIQYVFSNNPLIQLFEMLRSKRIDGVYVPSHRVINYFIKKYADSTEMRILPLPEEPIPFYTVFTKKSAPTYLARYEKAVKQQQAEISYQAYFDKWLARSEK
jgi:polar amino acid transport system substrate-binding protein